MLILGIETSCDETAAAVVIDGRNVLSNVVFSQDALHAQYGGVVPEIASRSHVEILPGVLEDAVRKAKVTWNQLDAIAVTYGPGLATSLLVGMSAAKALALRLGKPLCAVNHLEAHIYSIFLGPALELSGAHTSGHDAPLPEEICPFLALAVSGGHTCLVRVQLPWKYTLLGQTVDDAAGEAFDKGANLLGLGYPGGPAIEKAARTGDAGFVRFPRGATRKGTATGGLDPRLCFSFSGIKTALLYYLKEHPPSGDGERPGIAASYQEAIVDALVDRVDRAYAGEKAIAVVGGVARNSRLREKMLELGRNRSVRVILAAPEYCADNGAMVAGVAGSRQGIWNGEAMAFDAMPSLGIGRVEGK